MSVAEPAADSPAVAVSFHFNVSQPLVYAGRLLRKAARLSQPTTLWCLPHQAEVLEQWLWTHDPRSFIAHAAPNAPAEVRRLSGLRLCDAPPSGEGELGVLLNVTGQPVEPQWRMHRLIELVSPDPADRQRARQRWRQYQSWGWELSAHDAAAPPA